MTVFDVYLNGRKMCRAGVGANGVLTALVTWTHTRRAAAGPRGRARTDTQLEVGGLADDTHRTWVERRLKAGDRVTVWVVNGDSFDHPARVETSDSERRQQARTAFLNVDLDIWSKAPLDRLVDAFGGQVIVLRTGKENGRYGAHLEHARSGSGHDVDRAVRRLVRIVEQLPTDDRQIWNRAERREFNVGIQSGRKPHASEFRVEPGTLEAIARINARLTVTVYGAASATF